MMKLEERKRATALYKNGARKTRGRTEKFRSIFRNTRDGIFISEQNGRFVDANKMACSMLGYTRKELLSMRVADVLPREIVDRLPQAFPLEVAKSGEFFETYNIRKDGNYIPVEVGSALVDMGDGKKIVAIVRDISKRKRAEEESNRHKSSLEEVVRKRVRDLDLAYKRLESEIIKRKKIEHRLRDSKVQLENSEVALEQKNAALREILQQIESQKKQVQDNVIANIYKLVFPVIEKLKVRSTHVEKKYIALIQHGLEKVTSSFGKRLSVENPNLTLREVEICNMIRNGLSSKEIADLLHLSINTVEIHRTNIRRKFNILNKKVNLASFLQEKMA